MSSKNETLEVVKNKGGRPKGSTTKNTLQAAIKRFEANQLDAANVILQVMLGNATFFGEEKLKTSDRMSAAKYVITAPEQMRKTSDPSGSKDEEEDSGDDKCDNDIPRPLIQLVNK